MLERPPRGEPDEPPRRRLQVVRWGLVPSWAKDPSIGNRMINARMETVAEKPAFRRAFAKRRCLLPADGYFEWYGEVKGKKQPFFIRPADGGVLAMAGLYELWRDPSPGGRRRRPVAVDRDRAHHHGAPTTSAASTTGCRCSSRRERYAEWLDPAVDDPDQLRGAAGAGRTGPADGVPRVHDVNNVRNNGPDLVEPLPAEGAELAERRR